MPVARHRAALLALPLGLLLLTGCGSAKSTSHPGASAAATNSRGCTAPPPTPSSAKSFSAAPPTSLAAAADWTATVQTSCGTITVDLFGTRAPQTVASFISLARAAYWKNSPCHRLTTPASGIDVLQCGDPTGTGNGTPGYGYGIENAPKDGVYPTGTLAMARTSDPNSNGGQFFVVYGRTELPTAGGGYSIFGKVSGGMAIVDRIAKAGVKDKTPDGAPAQPISILSVSVSKSSAK